MTPNPRRIRDWGEHGSAVCVEKEDGALDERDREIAALRDRLSRLSEASLRISEGLDLDTCFRGSWTAPALLPVHDMER